MIVTKVNAEVLRAALKRRGIWLVKLDGTPTQFFHKSCYQFLRGVNL